MDKYSLVNRTAYMDFKKATDDLFSVVDHADLANALGVSVASIRQARLRPDARAHRTAPSDWEAAALQIAEERVAHYQKLASSLRGSKTLHKNNKVIGVSSLGSTPLPRT